MYGTLLDQRVFESLVDEKMPILGEHLTKTDVQLSVVSLPWFLSLYINSMPLVFAFRVLDVFFLEGPRVLFQIGLAILRINGEELLDVTDDGSFISVLKSYFSRLDESAHPRSENERLRAITRFQELIVVAFKEFSSVTNGTINELRAKHKDAVLESIESFAKRTSIRNLGPESKRLSVDDLGFLYDRFYEVLYERQQRLQTLEDQAKLREKSNGIRTSKTFLAAEAANEVEVGRVGLGPASTSMDYACFREFLAGVARWAATDSPTISKKSGKENKANDSVRRKRSTSSMSRHGVDPEPADHEFMQRLFRKWDVNNSGGLNLQNIVNGLALIKGSRDIMSCISYFFDLYDDDGDGKVDREGILRISETLLFLSRRGLGDLGSPINVLSPNGSNSIDDPKSSLTNDERFLGSVSDFIRRCFEYADPDHDAQSIGNEMDAFSIGEDIDEDDLLDLSQSEDKEPETATTPRASAMKSPTRSLSDSKSAANAALDPSKPLHITLPTFRMVILADELLEQFFESFFPDSFELSPATAHVSRTSTTSSSHLTTFTNVPQRPPVALSSNTGLGGGGIVPPGGKGLRGVLDNIVTDGMRMAAEVRKRYDEAQKELEKNATAGRGEDDDDEEPVYDEHGRPVGGKQDEDLLGGPDAEAASIKTRDSQSIHEQEGVAAGPSLIPLEEEHRSVEFEG